MADDRYIGRIGGIVALVAAVGIAAATFLTWIDVSTETISFTGQVLDAIPYGYQTYSGVGTLAGAAIAIVGGVLWTTRGRGSLGPLLVVIGAVMSLASVGFLIYDAVAEFVRYATRETSIPSDTIEAVVDSFIERDAITIEVGVGAFVAAVAAGIALVLGLVGIVVASSRRMAAGSSSAGWDPAK